MRGSELAEAVASAVDQIVSAREGTCSLDRAIEAIVGTIGRFGGKDATSYLEAYRAKIMMRDIPEDKRPARFPRVAMSGIHAEVLKVRAESQTWEELEGLLLESYGLDDALRLLKRDFMEWVETPEKGRNAPVLLREFEERFTRLSALDRTILDTSRVLLFVKSMDVRDREQVADDGLMADWAMVQRVCGRFDKRREWVDKGSTGAGTVLRPARPRPAWSKARPEERLWKS